MKELGSEGGRRAPLSHQVPKPGHTTTFHMSPHVSEDASTRGRLPMPQGSCSTHPMGVPLLASLESFAIAFEYVSSMVALWEHGGRWHLGRRPGPEPQFPHLEYLSSGSQGGHFGNSGKRSISCSAMHFAKNSSVGSSREKLFQHIRGVWSALCGWFNCRRKAQFSFFPLGRSC